MRAVLTLNEEYETRFLCCSAQVSSARSRGGPGRGGWEMDGGRRDPSPSRSPLSRLAAVTAPLHLPVGVSVGSGFSFSTAQSGV